MSDGSCFGPYYPMMQQEPYKQNGLEPVSPAPAGRFSTTVPPGKPKGILFIKCNINCKMLQKCKFIGFQKMDGMTLFICYDEGYILSSQMFTNVLRKWCWRLGELQLQITGTKKRKKETAGERHRDC